MERLVVVSHANIDGRMSRRRGGHRRRPRPPGELAGATVKREPPFVDGCEVILSQFLGSKRSPQPLANLGSQRAGRGIEQLSFTVPGEDILSTALSRADQIEARNQGRLDHRQGKVLKRSRDYHQGIGNVLTQVLASL